MTPEQITTLVKAMAADFEFLDRQIPILERYSLHKLTNMSLEKIAEFTNTHRMKVYNSIQRVEREERFKDFKNRLFALAK
jgi:predicted DNA-binding protein YlxM (UPF0122 family)